MKKSKQHLGVYSYTSSDYLMRNNGFSVGLNTPPALSGTRVFGLPPYDKRTPLLVDKYPACPKTWMRSEGKIVSYFVPVIENRGMWLDFNENEQKSNHVAIVISVQGINPITGLPCKDAQLEQYIEECPKHKIKFGPERYCKKCDYKWPKQNYITTTTTPKGLLWLDGFRTIDGVVRQYILTSEKMKGVASNIIGKDRVFAIGVSFFVSKEKKPKIEYPEARRLLDGWTITEEKIISNTNPYWFSPIHQPLDWEHNTYTNTCDMERTLCCSLDGLETKDTVKGFSSSSASDGVISSSLNSNNQEGHKLGRHKEIAYKGGPISINTRSIQPKKLEVSAGAKINQQIYDDIEGLDFWKNSPEAIICVNYCDEESASKIIKSGEIDLEGSEEGYLKKIPVGN